MISATIAMTKFAPVKTSSIARQILACIPTPNVRTLPSADSNETKG
jgi:hypothetical protein